MPPSELVAAPTPPPEIEVEVWFDSLRRLRALEPRRICVTHFGASEDPGDHLDRIEAWLREATEVAERGDAEEFGSWLGDRFDAEGPELAQRLRQAMPPDQLWLGLERYWRKRREQD